MPPDGATLIGPPACRLPPGSTEDAGAYATSGSSSASPFSLTQRETPWSIGVITRRRIQDLILPSVEAIASAVTRVHLNKGGTERAGFSARGFGVRNHVIDGTPLMPSTYGGDTIGPHTLSVYDRVEVVRGATGVLAGTGNPCAALSLVRKRPTAMPSVV